MNTLEILIPTYRRPESAAIAIESCLANQDQRISVRCNSNGAEPLLEKYRTSDHRLTYTSFDSNRGPHENFLYLLQHTKALFCMLLSDEDRLDPNGITQFLDFLDNCPDSIKVISCSVYDVQQKAFSFYPDPGISHIDHDLNILLALHLIPTYMSGLVFFVPDLMKIKLKDLLSPTMGNAYGHLDISRHLMINGYLRFYTPRLVLKGEDINKGGDAYSHRNDRQLRSDGNPDLNPLVYGPKARARQFYYSDNMLVNYRQHTNFISYLMAKMHSFSFFYYMVLMSDTITVMEKNIDIKEEVKLALKEAKSLFEYSSNSFLSYLFFPLIIRPKKFNFIALKILGKINGLFQKIMMKKVKANILN